MLLDELEPFRAARVHLDAARWNHGRRDGPIALVTGPGSHARVDFTRGLKKTAAFVRVEHFLARLDDPTAVAAEIRRARDAPDILLIAVCRGGGDERDLSVFSHPEVVRAVAEAATIKPVVTGIGHTRDHCLADDYASVAAELPYAAGEIIHQARQSAWRRRQPALPSTSASRTYRGLPTFRRPSAPIRPIFAGAVLILLAIAYCPREERAPVETSGPDLAPKARALPPSDSSGTKRPVPPPRQRTEAAPKRPADRPTEPIQKPARVRIGPPGD